MHHALSSALITLSLVSLGNALVDESLFYPTRPGPVAGPAGPAPVIAERLSVVALRRRRDTCPWHGPGIFQETNEQRTAMWNALAG